MIKASAYLCGPTTDRKPHIGNLRTLLGGLTVYEGYRRRKPYLREYRGIRRGGLMMNFTDLAESVIEQARLNRRSLVCHVNDRIRGLLYLMRGAGVKPWKVRFIRCSKYIPLMKKYMDKIKRRGAGLVEVTDEGVVYNPPGRPHSESFHLWRVGNHLENDFSGKSIAGWHLECAALVHNFGGSKMIHLGGLDLKDIHHLNEKRLLRESGYKGEVLWKWIHPLVVAGQKMSKSRGNIVTIKDGSALRYLYGYLMATPLDRTMSISRESWSNHVRQETKLRPIERVPKRYLGLYRKRCRMRQTGIYSEKDEIRDYFKLKGYSLRDYGNTTKLYRLVSYPQLDFSNLYSLKNKLS